jgi:hypothetical protein
MGESLLVTISKGGIAYSLISIADNGKELRIEIQNKYGCSTDKFKDVAIKAKTFFSCKI